MKTGWSNKLAYITTCLATALALALVGCGGIEDDGPVQARNLATGEIKTFPSKGEVPSNWAPCPDPKCSIPPYIPCEKLSEKVCTLHPACRLKTLWCMGQGSVKPDGTGTSSGGGSGGSMPPPPPPECKYACIPKYPLLCEELADEKQCKARSDCDWGFTVCPMCAPGGTCPPCKASCTTKLPPMCQALSGEKACNARSDCAWVQGPCPGAPCVPGGTCPPCPFTCQPKNPLPPPCPAIGFVKPDCKDGTIVPKYDSQGCLVGYECKPYNVSCSKLNQDYMAAVKAAKACNPASMLPVIQCSAQVDNQLFCPCPTFVNPGNSSAYQKLQQIKKQWQAQSCHLQEIACPAVMCAQPKSASCLGNATTGVCTDDPT